MRESRSGKPKALTRVLGLSLPLVLMTLIALPATAEAASDSTGATRVERERYSPRPLSIWVTPAAGSMGKTLTAGGDLRFALANGWGASAGFTYGEELCIFCNHVNEKFGAGSLLAGFRGVSRFGYASIAAGPNWGWEDRPDRDFVATLEDEDDFDCEGLFCIDRGDHPKVTNEGVGAQVQMQAALAGRYLGIGGQIQVIYVPKHVYAGASLIVPIGLIK